MSTGQHSDSFISWSHPASATSQSPWTETTEVFLDEGTSVDGSPSAQGPSTVFPLAPLINPQIFATTQFESPPLLHTRALHAAMEGLGHLLEERLPPAELPGQYDLFDRCVLANRCRNSSLSHQCSQPGGVPAPRNCNPNRFVPNVCALRCAVQHNCQATSLKSRTSWSETLRTF